MAVCLILAVLVVPVVTYSQAVPAITLWGVTTAGAAWSAASELALTVRAALAAPAFYSAAAWVTSTLGAGASALVVPMAIIGGLTVGAAFMTWLVDKGYGVNESGQITKTVSDGQLQIVPNTGWATGIMSWSGGLRRVSTILANETAFYAWCAANSRNPAEQMTLTEVGWVAPAGKSWGYFYNYDAYDPEWHIYYIVWPRVGTGPEALQEGTSTTVVSSQDVVDDATNDLTGQDAAKKAAAQAAVAAATAAVADAYNDAKKSGVWPPPALPGSTAIPPEMWKAWEDALKAGIPDAKKTEMGADDTAENYGKDTTNPPIAQVGATAPAATNVTVNVNIPEPPLPPDPPPLDLGSIPAAPEKSNLTNILQSYTDNLETLPIVSVISGAHLEIAGADPVLDLPVTIPPNPAVNVRIDFSQYESIVNTLGTLMLTYVSILWTIWLFKGRGDA